MKTIFAELLGNFGLGSDNSALDVRFPHLTRVPDLFHFLFEVYRAECVDFSSFFFDTNLLLNSFLLFACFVGQIMGHNDPV